MFKTIIENHFSKSRLDCFHDYLNPSKFVAFRLKSRSVVAL